MELKNSRLKRNIADQVLEISMLKEPENDGPSFLWEGTLGRCNARA